MGNKWILDVLADLRTFAEENDMPRLVDQIELASIVAAAEIVTVSDFDGPIGALHGEGTDIGGRAGEIARR